MIPIRHERVSDANARESLLDAALGPSRRAKASERLREGRLPADGLSFVATEQGRIVGSVRLSHVSVPAAAGPALLLGPLAVDAGRRNRGIGSALIRRALREATRLGYRAMLLVGDAAYYGRFGFSAEKTGALRLPGAYDQRRLLARELICGALDGVRGLIGATGRLQPKTDRAMLVGGSRRRSQAAPRAA